MRILIWIKENDLDQLAKWLEDWLNNRHQGSPPKFWTSNPGKMYVTISLSYSQFKALKDHVTD